MIWFLGFLFSVAALFGHPVAQSPQPMHFLRFIVGLPFFWVMACTWHLFVHVPQFWHFSGSMAA